MTYRYTLQCVTDACLPPVGGARPVQLAPVVVRATSGGGRLALTGSWPLVASVSSRLQRADVSSVTPRFRHPAKLSPADFGVSPTVLAGLLTAAGRVAGGGRIPDPRPRARGAQYTQTRPHDLVADATRACACPHAPGGRQERRRKPAEGARSPCRDARRRGRAAARGRDRERRLVAGAALAGACPRARRTGGRRLGLRRERDPVHGCRRARTDCRPDSIRQGRPRGHPGCARRRHGRRCATLAHRRATVLPPRSGGVVVLDLSASIASDTYSRIRRTLQELVTRGGRYGLVVFSSDAYLALPPGTPASALEPGIRYFTLPAKVAPGEQPNFPKNPWSSTFTSGTRISAGLELARQVEVANGAHQPAVVLVSDLADDPERPAASERRARRVRGRPDPSARDRPQRHAERRSSLRRPDRHRNGDHSRRPLRREHSHGPPTARELPDLAGSSSRSPSRSRSGSTS